MEINVYKIELLIIDHDEIGEDGVKDVLENTKYTNHCIYPEVKKIETRSVEWSDDHPLNSIDEESKVAYRELFG